MLKALFTVTVCCLFSITCLAQVYNPKTDTLYTYFNKEDEQINTPDSAYYVRMILPLDEQRSVFPMIEYYKNGKLRLMTSSLDHEGKLLQGDYVMYYENGKRKYIERYVNNEVTGTAYTYYPNGELYLTTEWFGKQMKYVECRDTSGNITAKDGNGILLRYDDEISHFYISGPIANGEQQGEWRVQFNDDIAYVENYIGGYVAKDGGLVDKKGKTVKWNKSLKANITYNALPRFPGGLKGLGLFLASTIRYPAEARKKKVMGRVYVSFVIEEDGKLSNCKIVKGLGSGCDEEVLRVLKLSPKWVPNYINGIPTAKLYKMPVMFNLQFD